MLRKISWLMALAAYFGPTIWAYVAIKADDKAQLEARGWICGNPTMGIVLLALMISTALSFIASSLGLISYCALPKPKPKLAVIELAVLILPLALAAPYLLMILFA